MSKISFARKKVEKENFEDSFHSFNFHVLLGGLKTATLGLVLRHEEARKSCMRGKKYL